MLHERCQFDARMRSEAGSLVWYSRSSYKDGPCHTNLSASVWSTDERAYGREVAIAQEWGSLLQGISHHYKIVMSHQLYIGVSKPHLLSYHVQFLSN